MAGSYSACSFSDMNSAKFFFYNKYSIVSFFSKQMPQFMLEDWMRRSQKLFSGNFFCKQGQLVRTRGVNSYLFTQMIEPSFHFITSL